MSNGRKRRPGVSSTPGRAEPDEIVANDDDENMEKYFELRQSTAACVVFTITCLLLVLTSFIIKVISVVYRQLSGDLLILGGLVLSLDIILLTSGSLVIIAKCRIFSPESPFTKVLKSMMSYLQGIFVISMALYLSVLVNIQVAIGACDGSHDLHAFGLFCAPGDGGVIPAETLLALAFFPMVFYFVLRDTRFEALILAWGLSVAGVAATSAMLPWQAVLPSLGVYAFSSCLIYNQTHRQNLALYLLDKHYRNGAMRVGGVDDGVGGGSARSQVEADLETGAALTQQYSQQNSGQATEAATYANEMRHMIANVAHDLKTVRTAHFYPNNY